jgi:hypothetical protein
VDYGVTGRLKGLRPLIKQRWEALLRAEPVASPLASPDTLVFLMDETLDQLTAALRTRSLRAWLRHNQAVIAPLQGQCACGINPLLAYYTTGRLALSEVAGEQLGPAFTEILLFYHSLAQKDIEALCGVCRHQGSDSCTQRKLMSAGGRHATLLGR